ncbi:MAG: polysaccharide deacetylase family protein [Deinococcales bacterium]
MISLNLNSSFAEDGIFSAIIQGDVATVARLLAQDPSLVRAQDSYGQSPLIYAIHERQHEIAGLLIAVGADVNLRLAYHRFASTILESTLAYGDISLLRQLIAAGMRLDGALFSLLQQSRPDDEKKRLAQVLLQEGAFLDELIPFNDITMSRSLIFYMPCLKSMADAPYNLTPDEVSPCQGFEAFLLSLLDSPQGLEYFKEPQPELSGEALAFAAMYAGPRLLEALMAKGVDIHQAVLQARATKSYPKRYSSLLDLAFYKENIAAASFFLAHGASLDSLSPFLLSLAAQQPKLAFLLKDKLSLGYQAPQMCTPPTEDMMISFILDDAETSDLEVIEQIFKPHGVQGAIAVIAGQIGQRGYLDRQSLESLGQEGWEIFSHSLSHAHLPDLDQPSLERELAQSTQVLSSLTGYQNFFVYPYGESNALVRSFTQNSYQAAFSGDYQINHPQTDLW